MAGLLSDRIIGVESNGNATAKNPNSSATGAGQFIEGTWLDMVGRYRPDLAGMPRADVLALRNDPTLSREMVGHYAAENGAKLRSAGLPDNDGTRYLSHVVGPAGARSVLTADPSTPLAQVLPANALAANRFMQPMSAGDLTGWAARKVGSAAPVMTMPGAAPARSGRFGFGGVEASAAAAPVAATPSAAQPEAAGGGYLSRLMAAVTGPSSGQASAASAPAAVEPAALGSTLSAPPQAPARFDARRFYALLQGRR
ncbi:hypothetical protein ASG52_24755 [Methylobacterium sp. Leaf456]|uniref:hypothetical protein n=1 Tax=Methylobacterium sp. Leaf456 TaxID=1736382 RepID=UPI0006FADF81|nr:hypothetical protein [Methylobacterium sp. Leaf456]KQT55416.1 hypothetical protein ASG52_24755 [Methylobacterium sp. Leaf456]